MLYCCGCEKEVEPRLTDGREIYPRRPDLALRPFWKCDECKNYVGCHWKTREPTRPLGCIPTKDIRNARKKIHAILDPLWKPDRRRRKAIYKKISKQLGWKYHTAKIRSIEEARTVYRIVRSIKLKHFD